MAFIVKKKVHGKEYYYLNESKREGDKVKSICLAYLGKNRSEAEKKAKEIMEGKSEKNSSEIEKLDRREKSDKIFAISNSRGLFFQTASIYGGKAGFFTYGHLGKLIKNNWENLWRRHFLSLDDNFYEIQSNNILPEKVFIASGHVDNFNDPLVECKKCNNRFRADHLLEDNGVEDAEGLSLDEMNKLISEKGIRCLSCKGELAAARQFNMMFPVDIAFVGDKGYLTPETAQSAYIAFKDEFNATRGRLPLGLAVIDKAYRNEISPRQGFFRLRDFTQAELQIFFDSDKINEHPGWDEVRDICLRVKFSGKEIEEVSCEELNVRGIPKFYLFHAVKVQEFYLNVIGVPREKFRLRELNEDERAFYNKIHFDVEVNLDTIGGFKEVGGIHYRTDHDLAGHEKVSGKKMEVNIDGKKFIPHVLELSFGVDRNVFMLLDVYFDKGKDGFMFKLPGKVAPIKSAVFPLVKNDDKLVEFSKKVYSDLKADWNVIYDSTGSVGRRYARNDEVGTPYCVTVDSESLEKNDITIRDRDTTKQIRVKVDDLRDVLRKLINSEIEFEKAGKLI